MITVIRLIQFVLKGFKLINIFEFEWCSCETERPFTRQKNLGPDPSKK